MYTSTISRLRTVLAALVVTSTAGMNTPTTSIVTSTVASAAKLGAALRRIDRTASRKKNVTRIYSAILGRQALRKRGHVYPRRTCRRRAHPAGELARGLLARVAAGRLVAHDPPMRELEHPPAHLVDHRLVVGGDEHGRAGGVEPVQQPR